MTMTTHDGFVWTDEDWGPALRSRPLGQAANHFFTTRQLWLRGDSEEADWGSVAAAIGVTPLRLFRLTQVHGRDVAVIRDGRALTEGRSERAAPPGDRAPDPPQADIAITDDPTVALAIQVADCVPLLLADPLAGAVAAVHAGWRGTAAGASGAAVRALEREFGVKPERLTVAMGPSIGPCCYSVGDELVDAFRAGGFAEGLERWFTRDEAGGLRLDVGAANRDQLVASGVPAAAIHCAHLCTSCRADLFASYRRDGPGTGRIAAVIRSKGRRATG
jgi:polyphenol oxidase